MSLRVQPICAKVCCAPVDSNHPRSYSGILSILPTRNTNEQIPSTPIEEIKYSGRVKLFPLTRSPITSGVMNAPQFEIKLNIPPESPISRCGAIVDTSDQPMHAAPSPKNDIVIHAITRRGSSNQ